jgi:serine protease Do
MRHKLRSFTLLSMLAALALGTASLAWLAPDDTELLPARKKKAALNAAAVAPLRAISDGVAAIVDLAAPSVVSIEATGGEAPARLAVPPEELEEFLRRFPIPPGFEFGAPDGDGRNRRAPQATRTGSGFIVNAEKGYVLTNNHVVGGADRIRVRLSDQRIATGELIGVDEATDVALVKIEATGLVEAVVGDDEKLRVGEMVVAIGSPFGLAQSVTTGIVSGKGRSYGLADYEYSIQTDAAINPGNSGGPLFNLDGEVIGINVAIVSGSRGSDGVGFAIPITLATRIAEQLLANGKVERGAIGVVIQPVTADLAESLGVGKAAGALVSQVQPNMPAQDAGLQAGDVIVGLDGSPVADVPSLRNRVSLTPVGSTVKLLVMRDGEEKSFEVEIGRLPGADKEPASLETTPREGTDHASFNELGLRLQELTPRLARGLGLEESEGALVAEVEEGSAAADAGLAEGMVVVRVGKAAISDLASFERELAKHKGEDSILLLVRDARGQSFVVVPLGTK